MTDTNLTQTQFEEALIDVRKAYRLLYLYQDRVLKTVKYISESLGFGTPTGFNEYCNSIPPNGKPIDLNFWAWDWLAMYWYKFDFGSRPNGIRFHIHIQSDTGFEVGKDKTNIPSFNLVENSQTRLLFILRKNTKEEIDETRKLLDEKLFLKQAESTCVLETKSENSYCLAQSFSFSRFINQTETDKCIEEFLTFCWQNAISEEDINWGQGVASDSKVRDEAQEKRHEAKKKFWNHVITRITANEDLKQFHHLPTTYDTHWGFYIANGISYRFNVKQGSLQIGIYIDTPDLEKNAQILNELREAKIEGNLTWKQEEVQRRSSLTLAISDNIGYKSSVEDWDTIMPQAFETMVKLIELTQHILI